MVLLPKIRKLLGDLSRKSKPLANLRKDLKTSNKKPSKRRGRQDKDWKTVNASIPMDPEEFA